MNILAIVLVIALAVFVVYESVSFVLAIKNRKIKKKQDKETIESDNKEKGE